MFAMMSCCPCSSYVESDHFSHREKIALGIDMLFLVAITAIGILSLPAVGLIHQQLVSYFLFGGSALIALIDIAKVVCKLRSGKAVVRNERKIETLVVEDKLEHFLVPYNENPLVTISHPMKLNEALGSFKGSAAIRQQGENLDKDFFYQRARGGGNCFYLSYLSSFLHYLVATRSFEEIVPKLSKVSFECPEKATFFKILCDVQQNPTFEHLYSILENEEIVSPLILYLRKLAVDYVRNEMEELTLKHTILCNDDLKDLSDKNEYCSYQELNGKDVQSPEILMLHLHFYPMRLYDRLERGKLRKNNGLRDDFSQDSPVVLFACDTNHFDCLLPKTYVI